MTGSWLNPTMTSNTAPYGVASASSEYESGSRYAWRAFDHDIGASNFWLTDTTTTGWLQYKFEVDAGHDDQYARVDEYRITGSGSDTARSPKNWTLLGSTTGAFSGEEVTLDTQTGITWSSSQERTFSFSNTNGYIYYRLNVTLNNGSNYVEVDEMKLYGEFVSPPGDSVSLAGVSMGSANAMMIGM